MYDQIFESGQTFECRPSRLFCLVILIFFMLTSLIILSIESKVLIKIGLLLITLFYMLTIFWQHGILRGKKSIVSIRKINQGWMIKTKNGDECEASLLGESWVSRVACLLLFRTTSSYFTQACLILPDSLPAPLYRKLRITVKMYG